MTTTALNASKNYFKEENNIETSAEEIQSKIRSHVFTSRRRVADVFHDFDKLRSGAISRDQFHRGVLMLMEKGPRITSKELQILSTEYEDHSGNINYSQFMRNIDIVFAPSRLEVFPDYNVPVPGEYVYRKQSNLDSESRKKLHLILEKMKRWVSYHGDSVKSWFQDFDRHHNGYVTIDQFHRSLPSNLLSNDEISIISKKYSDNPTRSFNYFRLHTDVNRKDNSVAEDSHLIQTPSIHKHDHHVPIGTENLLLADSGEIHPSLDLVEIMEKIKRVVYKKRVRLFEFCKDYDKQNHSLINASQFASALHMAGLELHPIEAQAITRAFSNDEERVNYRKFCGEIDKIFTQPDLEKYPTLDVHPPARDFLIQTTHKLSPEEEQTIQRILKDLRAQVDKRRITVGSYFLDFDKGCGNTGRVTKSHFSRVLSMLSLEVSEDDLFLLLKKYEDHLGDVIYTDFIKKIEVYDNHEEAYQNEENSSSQNEQHNLNREEKEAIFQKFMVQIQNFVSSQRIRIQEFFKDSDRLRSGLVRHDEFLRGITGMGFPLSEEECQVLVERYQDKERTECCQWKNFAIDLEKAQEAAGTVNRKNENSLAIHKLSNIENQQHGKIMRQIHQTIHRYPVLLKPFFRDFDKVGGGHVTPAQARQSLMFGKIDLSDEQFSLLVKKYLEKDGFDYFAFLDDLEEYQKQHEPREVREETPKPTLPEKRASPNTPKKLMLNTMLDKLKSRVKSERFRFTEFMKDFDPLRHGVIHKSEFGRALTIFNFSFHQEHIDYLASMFAAKGQPDYVDYLSFCKELESVFTTHNLEKHPLTVPVDYTPNLRDPHLPLNEKEEEVLVRTMQRLGEQIRKRRMDIYGSLEDFDRIHNGTITQRQFLSVLANNTLLVSQEEAQVLLKRFSIYQVSTSVHTLIDYVEFYEKLMECSNIHFDGEMM